MRPRWERETSWYVIYECVDADGVRLYIGMSIKSNFDSRLASHRSKPWWPRVAKVITSEIYSRQDALTWEAMKIRTHQPEGNIAHTRRALKRPMPPIESATDA